MIKVLCSLVCEDRDRGIFITFIMEKIEYYIKPKIVAEILKLQLQHALPVNITVKKVDGLYTRLVSFEIEPEERTLLKWLLDKAEKYYNNLTLDQKWDDND